MGGGGECDQARSGVDLDFKFKILIFTKSRSMKSGFLILKIILRAERSGVEKRFSTRAKPSLEQ
jgi:hypothetical protein